MGWLSRSRLVDLLEARHGRACLPAPGRSSPDAAAISPSSASPPANGGVEANAWDRCERGPLTDAAERGAEQIGPNAGLGEYDGAGGEAWPALDHETYQFAVADRLARVCDAAPAPGRTRASPYANDPIGNRTFQPGTGGCGHVRLQRRRPEHVRCRRPTEQKLATAAPRLTIVSDPQVPQILRPRYRDSCTGSVAEPAHQPRLSDLSREPREMSRWFSHG